MEFHSLIKNRKKMARKSNTSKDNKHATEDTIIKLYLSLPKHFLNGCFLFFSSFFFFWGGGAACGVWPTLLFDKKRKNEDK